MKVRLHRRRRIVHQSSDQVCVPRHNIVVLSLDSAFSASSFFRWGKESSRIHYDKPVRFYSPSLRLFLLRLSISPLKLLFSLIPISPPPFVFILPPSHRDPFFLPSIRFGDNNRRTNGANLQSRLANGRSRSYVRQTGQKKKKKKKKSYLPYMSVAASTRKFSVR